ncbi:MAG: class I SAM-dependent methyltransferase [Burkholderiaceae bacterium]
MRSNRASRTAEAAAAIRAAHSLHDQPVVFHDPYAIALTSRAWRWIARSRLLTHLAKRYYSIMLPVRGQVVARSRFCEDQLEAAMAQGVRQYVIVGAGFDSFALRRPDLLERLTVYELDHPATQNAKRERLRELSHELPERLVFVPVNFEQEGLATALARSSFDPLEPAFVSWLGTTYYLSPEAIFTLLRDMASFMAAGSEIVFDFSVNEALLGESDRRQVVALHRAVRARGEPFLASFDPEHLLAEVERLGYALVETLCHREQERRYFADRSDGLCSSAFARLAHFRLSAVMAPA